jgi:hypothetical protein
VAIIEGDFKLLEEFFKISCEFGMDLQEKRHALSKDLMERVYQRLKEKPERTTTEFRNLVIDIISEDEMAELAEPLEDEFNREEELHNLNNIVVDMKASFYDALVGEKYVVKYLFAWIDGINLIEEIFPVIKIYLFPKKFQKRRSHPEKNRVSNLILYVTSLVFRIYEMQRLSTEGLIKTNEDMNKYLRFFANEVTALSIYAIKNDFIPKISSDEEEIFKDNAELIQRVFGVINSK